MTKQLIKFIKINYGGLPYSIWLVLFLVLINSIGNVVTVFLSLYLVNSLGFSVKSAGLIVSCFGIGSIIGSYVSGYLSDNFISPSILSKVSIVLNGLTILLIPPCKEFYLLIVLILIMGIFNACFVPASRVWLLNSCNEKDKIRASGLRTVALNIGFGLGVSAVGIFPSSEVKLLFFFIGFILLLVGLTIFFLAGDPSKEKNKAVNNVDYEGLLTDSHSDLHCLNNQTPIKAKKSFIFREVFLLYFVLLCISLVFSQLRITYPVHLSKVYQLNNHQLSIIFLINTIIIIALQVPIFSILKKINSYTLTAVGSLLTGIGMFMLVFGNAYYYAIMSCIIWTIGEILFFSVIQVLIYDQAEHDKKGMHSGIYQVIYSLANMAGPAIGSYFYSFSSGNFVWWACGFLGVLSFLLMQGLSYQKRALLLPNTPNL